MVTVCTLSGLIVITEIANNERCDASVNTNTFSGTQKMVNNSDRLTSCPAFPVQYWFFLRKMLIAAEDYSEVEVGPT